MVKNKWRVASIILIIAIVILGGILYYRSTSYDLGNGIEINKVVFNKFANIYPEGTNFALCQFEAENCVAMEGKG